MYFGESPNKNGPYNQNKLMGGRRSESHTRSDDFAFIKLKNEQVCEYKIILLKCFSSFLAQLRAFHYLFVITSIQILISRESLGELQGLHVRAGASN